MRKIEALATGLTTLFFFRIAFRNVQHVDSVLQHTEKKAVLM